MIEFKHKESSKIFLWKYEMYQLTSPLFFPSNPGKPISPRSPLSPFDTKLAPGWPGSPLGPLNYEKSRNIITWHK